MESQGIIRTVIFYKMIMFWYVSDFIDLPLSNLKSVLGLGICRWITFKVEDQLSGGFADSFHLRSLLKEH